MNRSQYLVHATLYNYTNYTREWRPLSPPISTHVYRTATQDGVSILQQYHTRTSQYCHCIPGDSHTCIHVQQDVPFGDTVFGDIYSCDSDISPG